MAVISEPFFIVAKVAITTSASITSPTTSVASPVAIEGIATSCRIFPMFFLFAFRNYPKYVLFNSVVSRYYYTVSYAYS
jgi:hypothetical protein